MLRVIVLLLLPSLTFAQAVHAPDKATAKYILSLHDAETGAFKLDAKSKPSLRATSAAVRSLAKLETAVPDKAKTAKFVMKCFDKASGGFAEPEGKPDVTITSIGIMAACELGIDRDDFKPAMTYLEKNAKTFEDVRIGAAAVEVWGVKKCPFDLEPWFQIAKKNDPNSFPQAQEGNSLARAAGSYAAFPLRLGKQFPPLEHAAFIKLLNVGKQPQGGWIKTNAIVEPDLETTYRVMRAIYLLKTKPTQLDELKTYLGSLRNKDGGYGLKPGAPSSIAATYYVVSISDWLKALEK